MGSVCNVIVVILIFVGAGLLCSLLYYLNMVKEEIWKEIYKRMGE